MEFKKLRDMIDNTELINIDDMSYSNKDISKLNMAYQEVDIASTYSLKLENEALQMVISRLATELDKLKLDYASLANDYHIAKDRIEELLAENKKFKDKYDNLNDEFNEFSLDMKNYIIELLDDKESICKNWQDRLLDEYNSLKDKTDKLYDFLKRYQAGTLDFTPNCPYDILHEQYIHMKNYLAVLEYRIDFEEIN